MGFSSVIDAFSDNSCDPVFIRLHRKVMVKADLGYYPLVLARRVSTVADGVDIKPSLPNSGGHPVFDPIASVATDKALRLQDREGE